MGGSFRPLQVLGVVIYFSSGLPSRMPRTFSLGFSDFQQKLSRSMMGKSGASAELAFFASSSIKPAISMR